MKIVCLLACFLLFLGTNSVLAPLFLLLLSLLTLLPSLVASDAIPKEFKTSRNVCDCGSHINQTGRKADVILYTRNGSFTSQHMEFRCASKKCRAGYFYGFKTIGRKLFYDNDCLEKAFFSHQEKPELLYEFSLSIVHYQATFSALSSHFKDFHLHGYVNDKLEDSNERLTPTAKRITEGWLTYSLVEMKQRYNIPGPLFPSIDESLVQYNDLIKVEFSRRWSQHRCSVPGCSTVLIFDGGCKATRKICGAVKSGVREFSTTGFKVSTGCTNHPAPGERFCTFHKDHMSPALTPNQLSKASLSDLNQQQTNRERFLLTGQERDNIFVVEGILKKKTKNGEVFYQVKWENYKEPTWEPKSNIPEFITNYFEKTGRHNIPAARIKRGSKYHLLVWDDVEGEMCWEEDNALHIEDSPQEAYECNTRKDKDKRICRHTFGVLVGCSPCGVVTIFDELFRSENVKQVYAIVIDWLATLDDKERKRINQNPVVLNMNHITRFFGSRHLAVDCLHFLNHKDKNCQFVYDPYVPELNPVNTVICEQSFAWSNQYGNVKSMNGPRFNHFFHYLLDLHNLKIEGKLRYLANPLSEERMLLIYNQLKDSNTQDEACDEENDEVSFIYYGEKCNCSKNSTCKSSKCLCFLRNNLCSDLCHISISKCKNK